MKKAQNIEDIYHIFQPEKTITKENQDFYVDIFKESMKRFAIDLQTTQSPNKTFLIAGQSGNGKSSALNMLSLRYPKITQKYDFKYVVGRKNFAYIAKIDVADVLFNIAYSIIAGNEKLHKSFTDSLEKLEKKFNEELEEKITKTNNIDAKLQLKSNIGIGANILGFFKSKVDFSSAYSLNEQAIKSATEFFRFKRQDLIKLVNDLILDYKIIHNKELIVVVDDIEKRKDVNHLFLNNDEQQAQLPILNDLNLIKIITMPIHIARANYVKFGELKEFGLKLKQNSGEPNKDDIKLLKEVIAKRIENIDLINKKSIKKIINYSGANMNQLMLLIHKSALESIVLENDNISNDEVEKSKQDLQRELSPFVMNQRTFINKLTQQKITIDTKEDLENLEKAVSNNIVFAYFNGFTWFELNPVCEKSLKFYNKQAEL
jgi:energy-coupling factor transporter ATP-binding protein EcfA2